MRLRPLPAALTVAALGASCAVAVTALPVPDAHAAALMGVELVVQGTAPGVRASSPWRPGAPSHLYSVPADAADARTLLDVPVPAYAVPDATGRSWAWTVASGPRAPLELEVGGSGGVRRVAALPGAGTGLAWSPDGTRVAVPAFLGSSWQVELVDVATGAVTPLPGATPLACPVFVPGTDLVAGAYGRSVVRLVDTATGATTDLHLPDPAGATVGALAPTPDGSALVVLVAREVPGGAQRPELVLLPRDGGAPRTLAAAGSALTGLQVAPDGSAVFYSTTTVPGAPRSVWRSPLDGGPAQQVAASPTLSLEVLGLRAAAGTDAARPIGLTATSTASSVTLRWKGAPGVTGWRVRTAPGTGPAASTAAAVWAPGTTWTGAATGVTTLSVSAVTSDGVEHPASSVTVHPLGAVAVTAPRLVSATPSGSRPWALHLARTSGTASVATRWVESSGAAGEHPAWRPWSAGVTAVTLRPGGAATGPLLEEHTYAAELVPLDEYGNRGPTTVASMVVAEDERGAAYRGSWTSARVRRAAGGTLAVTTSAGASAQLAVAYPAAGGRVLSVLGERSPRGGRFAVLVDGRRTAVVDTRAPRTAEQAVLWQGPGWQRAGRHTLRLVALAGPRTRVAVDGFAVRSPLPAS
ncbi:hypothetical protein EV189_3464 [Motilibacter rhizosphaerae]|uniref:WD40 repeat protein n=1 Tax=Motilibacter rhizosphaerae TaxID=598652 RepID=A0A4Q7NAU3_9ACTN|nr:hypothetical protein [Motilibacter rhizosphaerae]RZS79985.1 hypothetical protein EV189_3464 [Motilibacter rhizosphaerae]